MGKVEKLLEPRKDPNKLLRLKLNYKKNNISE